MEKKFFIKKSKLFIIMICVLFSCSRRSEQIIHYELNGAQITRYDEDKLTFLYFGHCNNAEYILKNADVLIDWRFDDFLMASMIFHRNGKVELLSGGGGQIKILNTKGNIFLKNYNAQEYSAVLDKFMRLNGDRDFCRLNDNLNFELGVNKKLQSLVKTEFELRNTEGCK
ncbi:MAG: hypothetical protein EOO42_08185 [Flavobacteriales bacterium]|nr:MAG: hypothetical protein EOO42_08185 [Flavobacteriales bacterium]